MQKPDYSDRESVLKHLRYHRSTRRTICEVHREIYDLVIGISDKKLRRQIVSKLVDAYIMGNKMNDRLVEYHKGWSKGFYEENKDWNRDSKLRRYRKDEDQEKIIDFLSS